MRKATVTEDTYRSIADGATRPLQPTDEARALAMLDRLVRDRATYSVEVSAGAGEMFAEVWLRDPQRSGPVGTGPTVTAALLALGELLEQEAEE